MTYANEYGFMPGNDPRSNSEALQRAVSRGGEIMVCQRGVYDVSETVYIGNDTTLIFGDGVTLRRQGSVTGKNTPVFLNDGCDSTTYNRNISIIGLHLDCNGIEDFDYGFDVKRIGLRAHVAMIFIKGLTVRDYRCTGLLKEDYGIQISAFEDILLEDLYFEGDKDGVHLGWGKGFVIRRGSFCTFDDPIALNAFDYSTSNTHVGWIEDGLIEDCYDLNADTTTGYFCRILGGAWCDWKEGMSVQHSDTVCHGGRVYRAVLAPDGNFRTSHIPPTHTEPWVAVDYGGIKWVCVRSEAVYDCGCRNIVLRNIHLQKKRNVGIAISLNNDVWARSYIQGCKMPPQENITLENVYIENEVGALIESNYPCDGITVASTDLGDSRIVFRAERLDGLVYPTASLTLRHVAGGKEGVICGDGHRVCVKDIP